MLTWNIFHTFFVAFIVDFEQVNISCKGDGWQGKNLEEGTCEIPLSFYFILIISTSSFQCWCISIDLSFLIYRSTLRVIEPALKHLIKNSKMLVMAEQAMVLFYFQKFPAGLPVSPLLKYQISLSY